MVITLPNQNWFNDPDGDELTYTIGAADGATQPSEFFFDPARSVYYGWANESGTIRITATDPYGLSVSHDLNLIVDGKMPNRAPEATNTDADMKLDRGDNVILYLERSGWFTDPDGDALSYEVTAADGSATLPGGMFYVPEPPVLYGFATGSGVLKVTATDEEGKSASRLVRLIVDGVVPASAESLVQAMAALDSAADAAASVFPDSGNDQQPLLAAAA